jgi:hypothetical protein
MEKRVFKLDQNCRFIQELSDEKAVFNLNGVSTSRAYYNLIVSIRDVRLYSIGLKPHRGWKITDVKKYFGVKGDAKSIHAQLESIKNLLNQN